MATKRYTLENLGCANCAAKMEAKINALPQVESATITFATRRLEVTAQDPDALLEQMQEIVSSIEPEVKISTHDHAHHSTEQCGCGHEHDHSHGHHHHHGEEKSQWMPLLIGAGLFAAGLLLELMGITVFSVPVGVLCYIGAYGLLGWQVLADAGKNLIKGHVFDENFLMSIATLGAFAIGELPEAVGVMLFYRVGEFFEEKAVSRSRSQIMSAVDLRPETVTLENGQVIPAAQAQVGQLVLVRPGDRIPLDGIVISGESRIDTAPITGEPVPVAVRPNDPVTSGCVNLAGFLTVRVEKPLAESMVTRILQAVENAAAGKPKIDRFITRFARVYTPAVVIAAAVIALIPSLITGQWNYWIYTALSFLVMSCPCALVLSVPLAFFSGIGAGSKKGILFKGGLSIEALAGIKAVAADKTGTVTQGDFRVQPCDPALLQLCASCEQNSSHPIAVSITASAKEQGLRLDMPERLEEIPGHGIRAILGGKEVLCGNEKLLTRFGIQAQMPQVPGTRVLVASDGKYLGYLQISDTVKPGAEDAFRSLKAMGIHTALLTGDTQENARAVAEKAAIEEFHGRLLPEDKLTVLQKIRQARGATMFVGDGINDAPVLAGADVGAAMGSGADAAIEAADVVFMTSDIAAVPASVRIARDTRRIAWQNVVFALAVKLIVMILGLLGYASMWLAVFADSGVAMLCVLNSIRMLYQKK